MPKRYSEETRRKVLDLVAAGRSVARVSAELGIAAQTIYNWQRQELIASGRALLTRAGMAELVAAQQRIVELENELSHLRRSGDRSRDNSVTTPHNHLLPASIMTMRATSSVSMSAAATFAPPARKATAVVQSAVS